MMVDDEYRLLEQAEIFLERKNNGFDIDSFTSPANALVKLKGGMFDIVVSDYQMPGMDGLDLLRTIRQDIGRNVPFIMFTGKGDEELAKRSLALGANRYIQKAGTPNDQYGFLARAIEYEVHRYWKKESDMIEREKKVSAASQGYLDSTQRIF